jgi:hypothetical protein
LSSQTTARKRLTRSKRLKRPKNPPRQQLPQARTQNLTEPIGQDKQIANNSNSRQSNPKIISVITRLEAKHLEQVGLTVKICQNRLLVQGEKSKEVIL